jgi:uncharacterized protein YndB with AHSA1/START domain
MADQKKSHDNPLELKFSTIFKADPKFVFKALTHPDLIKKWFGPHGYTCPVVEVDLRVGGKYHIEMKPPEGEIVKLDGVYNVVNPSKALAYTWQWDEPDGKETLVKVRFNRSGKGTEVTVEQGEFASVESKEGHEQGWLASFERLKEVLQVRKT